MNNQGEIFNKILNMNTRKYIKYIISPIAPYFICNFYISNEILKPDKTYRIPQMLKYLNVKIESNDLLRTKDFHKIKNYDIIQCQVNKFKYFINEILPIIKKNNKKIILITSQCHFPSIERNSLSDKVLNDNNILLWISQNPIYENTEKYLAIPYGIKPNDVYKYIYFIKNKIKNNIIKEYNILNLKAGVHDHLPDNHIRKKYNIFGKDSGELLPYNIFLKNISKTKFLISTTGDREDTYRHCECIGLKTIPISDMKTNSIFNSNMINSNVSEMLNILKNNKINYEYVEPNQDIITIEYWKNIINAKIKELVS